MTSPITGTTAPITHQMKNDEPRMRPTIPVATPNQTREREVDHNLRTAQITA